MVEIINVENSSVTREVPEYLVNDFLSTKEWALSKDFFIAHDEGPELVGALDSKTNSSSKTNGKK